MYCFNYSMYIIDTRAYKILQSLRVLSHRTRLVSLILEDRCRRSTHWPTQPIYQLEFRLEYSTNVLSDSIEKVTFAFLLNQCAVEKQKHLMSWFIKWLNTVEYIICRFLSINKVAVHKIYYIITLHEVTKTCGCL